jgi:hypothetical protein
MPTRPTESLAGAQLSPEMRDCIDDCLDCHSVCLASLSRHCLEAGGKHVEAEHVRRMLACAELCRAAAAVMMIGTEIHRRVCAVCAQACDACARSCEEVGEMDECVEACRNCAESCREKAA